MGGRWLFAVGISLLAGAACAGPVWLVFALARSPLGPVAALPVFCAVSALAAPFAAPNTKEKQAQRAVCGVAMALAAAAALSLARPLAAWGAGLSVAATAGVLLRARFRSPAEFVALRKPPTQRGL